MNLKDNELALTTEVEKPKYKYKMNKKQGFKGNCRVCGKYGHKAANCWETRETRSSQKKQFSGKCNYCGMKGHKEIDCWKKARENKESEKANVAEDNENTVLMATSDCNEECTCGDKCQFNKKVKETLLLEDAALGCWVYEDVPDESSERNEEDENEPENATFDPNEQQEDTDKFEESQQINLQDLMPNEAIPLEFWSAVNSEMVRILDRNTLVMIDARASNDQEQASDYEWPPLPEEHRTVENVEFVEMFRSGRIRLIDINEYYNIVHIPTYVV